MKPTEVINKIIITAEAVFDYEETLGLGRLDRRSVKAEVEEYMNRMNGGGRLLYDHYFRCKFYDEDNDRMLMLFLYRAEKISVMQNWRLVGICLTEDWTEDAEYEGLIRAWVETKINDLPDEDDWVVKYCVNQILKYSEKTLFENVLQEVINAFECERDKETAKGLALLQSIYFEFRERVRIKPKTRKSRKSGKRS